MKEKMQEWAKAEWVNLSEKSAKSLINRVISVMEKEPTSLRSALTGLTQSLNALASKEDTPEQDTLELWFVCEFITNILLPITDTVDTIVKAKSAEPKKAKRVEYYADTQEEALALKAQAEAQTPARPKRGKVVTQAPAPAIKPEAVALLTALLEQMSATK